MVILFESNFEVWFNDRNIVSLAARPLKLLNFEGKLLPPPSITIRKPGGSESLRLTSSLWCGRDLVKTCIIASEVNVSAGCSIYFRMRRLPRFCVRTSESVISFGKNAFCAVKANRMSLTNFEGLFTTTQKPSNWLTFKLEMWNHNPPAAFERLIARTLSTT
ncbi:MAG: hypothetical protein ACTS6A_02660 [Candidatus Hodgkinia cicadicola]